VAGMRTTSVSAGARPRLHNKRQRHQRKRRREDILDGNKEALISAVKNICIRAIERARGGAGWFGFQQALHGILGTLFWRKNLRATTRPELMFWNKIFMGSPWYLGHSILAENFTATKKPLMIFWNKFSPGVTGEKARMVFTLCKASSGYTRKNWVGFHTWNLIADSKQH